MVMHSAPMSSQKRGDARVRRHSNTHCRDVVYVVRRKVVACIEVQRHDEQAHEDLVADAGAQESAVLVVARRAVLWVGRTGRRRGALDARGQVGRSILKVVQRKNQQL